MLIDLLSQDADGFAESWDAQIFHFKITCQFLLNQVVKPSKNSK